MAVSIDTVALNRGVTKAVDDYRNSPADFIADYVAPVVSVQEKSGYLPRFNRLNQKLIDFGVDPFAPTPRVDYGLSTTPYTCEVHRGAANLPFELQEFDDTKMLSAANLAIQVDEAIRIEREYELAALLVTAGTFTNTVDVDGTSTAWNATGGNPVADITKAMDTVHKEINRWPRYGLCSADVGRFLRQYVADLRVSSGNVALAPLDEVARYLGLKELRILGTGYDSAKPGLTSVGARMGETENFWLFHKPDNMNQFAPCFFATARYPKLSSTQTYIENDPEGLTVRVRDCYDLVEVDDTAAVYLYDCLE